MTNERITMSNSNKVGTDFPEIVVKSEPEAGDFPEIVVKSEPIEGDLPSGNLVDKLEVIPYGENGKTEASSLHTNSESMFKTADLLTDVKIKKEEDESEITCEYGWFYCSGGECEDQNPLQGVTCGTESESNEKESHSNNLDTRFGSDTFLASTDSEGAINETQEGRQNKENHVKHETDYECVKEESHSESLDACFESETYLAPKDIYGGIDETQEELWNTSDTELNINYDTEIIEPIVVVKIEDQSQTHLQALETHSSTGNCLGIYYQGECGYSSDSQNLPESLENVDEPSFPLNFNGKLKNGQKLGLKVQDAEISLGPFLCEKCGVICEDQFAFSVHLRVHSEDKFWQCTLCPGKFAGKVGLWKHIKIHSGDKRFKCELCPAEFRQLICYEEHVRMHNGERPFECEQCPAKFGRKVKLDKHVKSVHSGKRPFACSRCPERFTFQGQLTTHLLAHSGGKPFRCELCPLKFITGHGLQKHMKDVHFHSTAFECYLCLAKFKRKVALNDHLRMHLEKTTFFKCQHCTASFTTKSCMQVHERAHLREEPYECEHCSAKFYSIPFLESHLKVHSGEKPFMCKLCREGFARICLLQRHLNKVHFDARPFKCKLCGAYFKQNSALIVHLKMHTGERSFSCKYCPAKCINKSSLKKHLKLHRKKRR